MIYLIEIYIPILVSRQRDRRKKKKKRCEFRLPVKLLSRSFCHFFVSLPPLSRSDAFSFLTLKTCQDERKEWSGGRRRRGAWARKLVGKRRETKRPWHWSWGRMANSGIVKGNFWASVSSLSQLSRIKKKKYIWKMCERRKFYISMIYFFFFFY